MLKYCKIFGKIWNLENTELCKAGRKKTFDIHNQVHAVLTFA